MTAVQRAEPTRMKKLATAAAEVDKKNAQVCFITPLDETDKLAETKHRLAEPYERDKGYGGQDGAEQ